MEKRSRRSFCDSRRKSLTLNNIFIDDSQNEPSTEKPRRSIKSYLESLKKEKQDWKDILREKKTILKESKRQLESPPLTVTAREVEKFLTPENVEFLNSKPDYLRIYESVEKYILAMNYLSNYKLDIIDYYNRVYNELEIDKMSLVEEMCTDDLCEICNIKNCQVQEHKFIL